MMRRLYSRRQHQRGVIAIIVAISIAALIGFVGLALDLGKLFIAKTELQNGSDACALAAAQELTGTSTTQLTIAEAAGITTGNVNRVIFQSEPVAVNADSSVTFSETLNGAYQPKFEGETAKLMKYARCTVNRTGIANWFIQVLNVLPGVNIGSQAVAATAVAGLTSSQTNCAIPVALCSGQVAGTPSGTWLEGALGPQGSPSEGNLTGSFKWVDFTPPNGGASELGELLKGPGVCNLPTAGTEVGEAGVISSLSDKWNSRFGIYKGSTKPADAVPDFAGYAYTEVNWPSMANAYAGFKSKRSANAMYIDDAGLSVSGEIKDSAYLAANGADRRVAIAPVVDCAGFVSGTTAPVQSWACILMLHPLNTGAGAATSTGTTRMYLEYLGLTSDPASPCVTLGVPGAPGGTGPKVPTLVQ